MQVTDDERADRHGAEVHLGGALVGFVDNVQAERNASGEPIAVLGLKLNKSIGRLPVDSTFVIRLKGSIGQKYLAIGLGRSSRTLNDGATVPVRQTSAAVDLDQVLSMFSPPTRKGVVASTVGFSDGLASRGAGLNDAIGAFVPLLGDLAPVARNLAAPNTDLAGFLHGLESFAGALAPVAGTQAALFANLDGTFRALASVATPYLQDTISNTPPAFSAVIADTPTIRPFLTDSATLFSELRPGFATLPTSAPVLADAFAAGTKNLPGTAKLETRLVSLSNTLAGYSANPSVQQGLDRLTLFSSSLRSPLAFLTPVQSTCNYATLFLRNVGSVLSESTTPERACASRWWRSTTSSAASRSRRSTRTRRRSSTQSPSTDRSTSTRTRTPTRPARRRNATPGTNRTRARRRTSAMPGNDGLKTEQTGAGATSATGATNATHATHATSATSTTSGGSK